MPSARRPGAAAAPGLVVSGLVMLDDKENVMAGLRGLKGWKHRNQEKKPAEEPAAAAAAPLSNNRSTTPPQPGGAALELFSPSKQCLSMATCARDASVKCDVDWCAEPRSVVLYWSSRCLTGLRPA